MSETYIDGDFAVTKWTTFSIERPWTAVSIKHPKAIGHGSTPAEAIVGCIAALEARNEGARW